MEDLDVERLRDAASAAAAAADAISMASFGGQVDAEVKDDGSFVTAADKAVEEAVREQLHAATGIPIYGEEHGGRLDADTPTWVVDPIDATNNFLRGIPVFATLIGLVVDNNAVVGVVSAPALGERWDGGAGLPARRNGIPVSVSAVDDLGRAQVLHGGLDWWRGTPGGWDTLGRIADRVWRTRGFGDFWMHLLVAGGMAEAAIERDLKPWDVAAVQAVVTAAGGRMTSWNGESPLVTGEAVSTNGVLHDDVLALLAQ